MCINVILVENGWQDNCMHADLKIKKRKKGKKQHQWEEMCDDKLWGVIFIHTSHRIENGFVSFCY